MINKTLVIIKPDACARKIVGRIISIFEDMFLSFEYIRMTNITEQDAKLFYKDIQGLDVFDEVISFITSSPVVVLVLSGENAIVRVRKLIGATSPIDAIPGTIRFFFASSKGCNYVHASDSYTSFIREVSIVAPDFKL